MRRPLRVLVVDDDEDLRESTPGMLTQLGDGLINANSVGTLKDALSEADKGLYSTVLLDLGLPDARGVEAVEAFQAKHPELPVVVFSGQPDPDLQTKCLRAGAEDFVAKGADCSTLIDRVRSAVVRHEVKREFKPLQNATDALDETLGKMADVHREREDVSNSGSNKVVKP